MTWSYTGIPTGNSRDAVRAYCGDIDIHDQLLQDEVIEFALSQAGHNAYLAASMCCEFLAARFARCVDETVGPLSRSNSQRAEMYWKLSQRLSARSSTLSEVFCGGISRAGKRALNGNSDAVQPYFKRDLNDNPGGLGSYADWGPWYG